MALDLLNHNECQFSGPALPEPFVQFELERLLQKHKLLPDISGKAGEPVIAAWEILRRKLRDVTGNSGPLALRARIIEPLVERLGYKALEVAPEVQTREGPEDGGVLLTADNARLRCWTLTSGADLDAPSKRGYAFRYSPVRVAQRVLLASGERLGLITNGDDLRLLICDPARADSHVQISLEEWRKARALPDSYRFLLAIASPAGVAALPDILEQARLGQNRVTKELRKQARFAVERFIQHVLDHPANVQAIAAHTDKTQLAKALWHEGLVVVYRLLFVLKCESTADPSRVFGFASTPMWRDTYSPTKALAKVVRKVIDSGQQSGRFLEEGVRTLFRMFAEGVTHPGLAVRPLGGALFGPQSTPLLSPLTWGEQAVANLLDCLLWTQPRRGSVGRERVHYGPLDVEDLGRVYEALLELEAGIATEPMCRLRRQKLEVVVPAAQGEKYKAITPAASDAAEDDADEADDTPEEEEEKPARGKKTKVEWIEAIPAGRFFLRVGLGRKSSGSFYTPTSFVKFLVQETLGPQCDQRSPRDNPNPGAILKLKVLDPACGSGHFLVEACRFLATRLYESARQADELASKLESQAQEEQNQEKQKTLLDQAKEMRQRLVDLPDNQDELLKFLPSHAPEGGVTGYSQAKADAICRRMIAVHCLYGVDLNPLAVELARLSLWIESHAEGLPLTFLDHRIVVGNSLTGPFWEKLILAPGSQQPIEGLWIQGLYDGFTKRLGEALSLVKELEASVGVDVSEIAAKEKLKRELDARLLPFRTLAAAWSGGVMLGTDQPDGAPRCDDGAYVDLLKCVGTTGQLPVSIDKADLLAMIEKGRLALAFDLTFPEVFHPTAQPHGRHGFDAVIGNPPWDKPRFERKEFIGSLWLPILEATRLAEWEHEAEQFLTNNPEMAALTAESESQIDSQLRVLERAFPYANGRVEHVSSSGDKDLYLYFAEVAVQLLNQAGCFGFVTGGGLAKNTAAAGTRKLCLTRMRIRLLMHFINLDRLFSDLPQVVEYCLIVCEPPSGRKSLAFVHSELRQLPLTLAGGLPEGNCDLSTRPKPPHWMVLAESVVAETISDAKTVPLDTYLAEQIGSLTRELDKTLDDGGFVDVSKSLGIADARDWQVTKELVSKGLLPLRGSRTFHVLSPRPDGLGGQRSPAITLAVQTTWPRVARFIPRARYYRCGLRRHVGSIHTNERSLVPCLFVPGHIANDQLTIEGDPGARPNCRALIVCGVFSAFATENQIRQYVGTMMSLTVLRQGRSPLLKGSSKILVAHASLRCMSVDCGYESLWREQLGDAWREPGKQRFTWPVLSGDDERWAVRAGIDAVVADAYGLSREQYAHVLSTFSHASYKKAPDLCLAAFDELKSIGLEAFCKKHDPYHDIPLVETLPKPVIDLSIPTTLGASDNTPGLWEERNGQLTIASPGPLFDNTAPPKRKPTQPTAQAPQAADVAAVKTVLEINPSGLSPTQIEQKLSLSAGSVKKILKHLTDTGSAVAEGRGKGTKYRFRKS